MTNPTYDLIARELRNHGVDAAVEHTGGGIYAVRVDVAPEGQPVDPEGPHVLLTPRADIDGKPGIAIGRYVAFGDEGVLTYVDRLNQVHAAVLEQVTILTGDAFARAARDAARRANAFYVQTYNVSDRFDAATVVRRIASGGAYLTLAELNTLEVAGLAFGYHVKTTSGYPGLSPLGRALARISEGA